MRYSIQSTSAEEIKSEGAKNVRSTANVGLIFADLTDLQVEALRKRGIVVTAVPKVKADVSPPVPIAATPLYTPQEFTFAAGLDELRTLTEPPLLGERFIVAVLDTGIRETHEGISGRVINRYNYTNSPMPDVFDHGTGVCSVILAVAPNCSIINMKVIGDGGEGTEEEVVGALDDCITLADTDPGNAPSVINLSLGSEDIGDPDTPMRVACRAVMDRGIWVIAAAGNGGPIPSTITSPACEKYVVAVGSATYEPFAVSSFSSRGPTKEGIDKPDIVFFGENVILASSKSDTANVASSGTSFSCPFATGCAILYQEAALKWSNLDFPSGPPPGYYIGTVNFLPVEEVIDLHLINACYKPPDASVAKDNNYGYGIPLGTLIMNIVKAEPGLDFSSLLMGVMAIGMMGVMMKAVKK